MKSFREQFAGRIDGSDGSVVLRETEYKQIQKEAFDAGVKVAADKFIGMIREKLKDGPIQLEP